MEWTKPPDKPPAQLNKRTLDEILELMDDLDTAIAEGVDLDALGDQLRDKVDDIVFVTAFYRARGAHYAEWSDYFGKMAGRMNGEAKRIEQHADFVMQKRGFESLPGKLWRFCYRKSQRTVTKIAATAEQMFEFGQFIKDSYTWDARAVKEGIKEGLIPPDVAVIEEHQNFQVKHVETATEKQARERRSKKTKKGSDDDAK